MSGILEQIVAQNEEILALLKAGGTAAPKAATTAAAKKAAAAEKPKFTAEELRDHFLEVQKKHGDQAAKELIADCGYDKLAKLIADTSTWQASWDKAEVKLAEDVADDDGGL